MDTLQKKWRTEKWWKHIETAYRSTFHILSPSVLSLSMRAWREASKGSKGTSKFWWSIARRSLVQNPSRTIIKTVYQLITLDVKAWQYHDTIYNYCKYTVWWEDTWNMWSASLQFDPGFTAQAKGVLKVGFLRFSADDWVEPSLPFPRAWI